MKNNNDKKEEKENKDYTDMKEFISALYKLIVAKTENLELESKLNKQFMKDRGIGAKIEADSEQDWPDEFSEEWGQLQQTCVNVAHNWRLNRCKTCLILIRIGV